MTKIEINEKCKGCPINPLAPGLTGEFYEHWDAMRSSDPKSVVPGCCKREDCPFKERYDKADVSPVKLKYIPSKS